MSPGLLSRHPYLITEQKFKELNSGVNKYIPTEKFIFK